VGRVERIQIDPQEVSQTIVSIALQPKTPVKKNTRAVLNVQGITGLKFIELVGGTSDVETIAAGSEIHAGTSVVDKLTGQAESISIKAEMLINNMLELTNDNNRALVSDILERSGSLMNNLDIMLTNNTDNIGQLISSLTMASSRLAAAMDEIRKAASETKDTVVSIRRSAEMVLDSKRITAILDDTRGTIGDVRKQIRDVGLGKMAKSLDDLIRRTSSLVERVELVVGRSKEDIRTSLRLLAETSANLKDFSRLIREDPSRLLRQQERRERVLP
jgi:phospholipid/cholesterol/gamma-HCH transport system substrate-binding protein